MKRTLYPILGILVLGFTVFEVHAMRTSRGPATAQQQIQASVLTHGADRVAAEGQIVAYPGAEVAVGTDVAGTLERVAVEEKQSVRKGDVIAVIRADDTRAALIEAKTHVGEADADIRLYESQVARAQHLLTEDVGSKQDWEKAARDLDSARAKRASAVAEVKRLEAVIAKTVILAPIDGVVIERTMHGGETVAIGDHLVTIANLAKTRIEAEVDEFDVARVKLGDTVTIHAEGFDEQTWQGKIEEIPDSVTNRRLKPADPAKPVDTRVLLVKVAMTGPTPLKLGQRVEVEIGHPAV